MSESTSEDFSDSGSDESPEEKPNKKVAENGKRKVLQKKKGQETDSDSSDDDNELETAAQPIKKRKTLQDYLNEKVNKFKFEPS